MPYDKRLAKKKKFQNVKTSPIKLFDEKIIESGVEKDMYIQLCRGIDLRPPKVTKDLFCKYESRKIPYYTYGPRKIEVVSFSPYIAVMHDFIMPSEMKSMRVRDVKEHVEIHFDGLSFPCQACDAKLRSRNILRNHMSRFHK